MPQASMVGYARVSGEDQHLDRQLAQLKDEKVETILVDKVSEKNLDRPGIPEVME